MGRFTGKTAVITGSGRRGGLGEAIALRLAKDGANIVISDIGKSRDAATGAEHIGSTDEMESIAEELRKMGVAASTCICDVRSLEEVKTLAKHAKDTHGSLDIWVNNAGIGYIMKPLLEVTEDDWRAVIDVNLSGAFFGRPTRVPNMASWVLPARQQSSLGSIKLPSIMFALTMLQRRWAHGRTNILLKSSAQIVSRITSRPWPPVSQWAVRGCPKTPPMLWPFSVQMTLNISQPSR